MRLLALDRQDPASRAATGNRRPVVTLAVNGRLESQRNIRPLSRLDEMLAANGQRPAGLFFVTEIGHHYRDIVE